MKLALILVFLSPANMFGYFIQSLLLLFFLLRHFFIKGRKVDSFQMKSAYIWALLCVISILIGMSIGGGVAFTSYLLFIFVFFSIILFPFDIKVPSISSLLLIISYLILFSQLIIAFRIEPFSDILLNIYSNDEQLIKEYIQATGVSQLSWSRFGGVFINPNQCAKAYTFVLGLYLAVSPRGYKSMIHISLICFIGLLLTGSRTGMGIAILMMMFGSGVSLIRLLMLSIPLIIALSIAIIMNLRFIDLDSLIISFTEKNHVIIEYILYINDISIAALLFGIGDISRIEYDFGMRLNSFDSEFGYLLQGFGLMSFFVVFAFIWSSFRSIDDNRRVFLLNLLWLLSSTILVNIRFGFIYFICLSIIHSMQEHNKGLGR
ncbi:hypothetical protein H5123_12425 [Shewanella sp. SR43-4]|uniref:hypothetical protein n=1 Tax=Shewanella sp. SR43-4 TaxID=2760942 RepID=UPI0015F903EE|nr:hypothetical protein [Shewanella sp. SR43-4]MBB1318433.1 hypothetical protein [Shewanella sp. SR43-4]